MKEVVMTLLLTLGFTSAFAQTEVRKFQWGNSSDGESIVYAYLPEHPTGRAVIAFPGGGYTHLSMENEGHDWASFFNEKGIAYFVLRYRMPYGDRNLPLEDAYHAIETVRDSADSWKLNPQDVGIMGFSAGGHLASSVCTHAEWKARPDFSILFYPVISMDIKETHRGSVKGFLGDSSDVKSLVKEWSNQNVVRPHLTPRSIILLANDDGAVPPVTNGVAYYSAMRRAGNECAMMIYPSGGHGFGFKKFAYHDQMLSDLGRWLDGVKAPRKDAIRVACIGNSITDGFGIDMADKKGYPAQLQQKLGSKYRVMNFGVSSRTLMNKGDYPYQNEQAWKDALAFEPNIVVIKLGTNDSKPYVWQHKADFQKDYQMMIDKLKALKSNPRIYICTPIPGDNEKWGITDKVMTEEVIPEIKKAAKKNKLKLIDLHTLFKDDDLKQMQSDGVHPTQKGAGQLADIIYTEIK